ncbi:hypothetical protein [Caulobacter sp. DWR1-3-2b1]|uniref:hypothetical protein n=1 Tax=Caulobacter sp. DWR1-3-2b1 TaxID=2804670 RepID=UPI003CEB4DE5
MLKLLAGVLAAFAFGLGAVNAAPVEAYGRLPAMSGVDISASGEQLAYIVQEGGAAHVVV